MLKVGFIGLGMGRAHMKGAAAHPDAKVVACCDIVEERRKNKDGVDVAEEFEGCKFYTDYKEMIAKEELDAVVIASPDQLHKEMCEYCLNAGLHVLCEIHLQAARTIGSRGADPRSRIGSIGRHVYRLAVRV